MCTAINEKYKACLDAGKTERECVKLAVEMAKEAGYQDIKDVLKEGKSLKEGDKVYAVCMEKMLAMFRMGEEPLSNGMNILGAHIDSPRIDVKQNPLYESEGMAYLDTHYYGGIKKYQWVTGPMALHGVVAKKDGSVEEIADVTVGADDLHELVTLKKISNGLMERIHRNYRLIVGINTSLIVLGVAGAFPPTTSALLHNTSTLLISLKSMNNLLDEKEEVTEENVAEAFA